MYELDVASICMKVDLDDLHAHGERAKLNKEVLRQFQARGITLMLAG